MCAIIYAAAKFMLLRLLTAYQYLTTSFRSYLVLDSNRIESKQDEQNSKLCAPKKQQNSCFFCAKNIRLNRAPN